MPDTRTERKTKTPRGSGLKLRRIDAPTTDTAGTGRLAWFRLAEQRWAFLADGERERLINAAASAYAGLVGRKFHMRVTHRPYEVASWAQAVTKAFPDPLPGWGRHVRATQAHLLGQSLAPKEVYLGVELKVPAYRRKAAADEVAQVTGIVGGPGLEGRPATAADLAWLMHRSVALAAPGPLTGGGDTGDGVWESSDLAEFTDRVRIFSDPFDRSATMIADGDDVGRIQRHVAVLTLGRMQGLPIPGAWEPWLTRSDRVGPVEWSIIGEIPDPAKVRAWLTGQVNRVNAQLAHNDEHGERPPESLMRQQKAAARVQDDVETGNPLTTRVYVWARAAVHGATREQVAERVGLLRQAFEPKVTLHQDWDQVATAREFVPGEPLSQTAHRRQMPVTTWAAGLPQASSAIGDPDGFYLGTTCDGRAVFWHPWAAMERRNQSGGVVVTGKPGCGKSNTLGLVGYNTPLASIPTVILDPSGPLARLTRIPELRAVSRAVDLLNAPPGTLNPYALIPDPRRDQCLAELEDGMTDDQWRDACETQYRIAVGNARAARQTLVVDTLLELLRSPTKEKDRSYEALFKAVRKVDPTRNANPRHVLAALRAGGDDLIADMLEQHADMAQVQLLFPEGDETPDTVRDDYLLQVLTMRGLVVPPPKKPRVDWTTDERLGLPLLALAAHLANRHVYDRPMDQRKCTILDETHKIVQVPAGVALVRDGQRDSRKFNNLFIVAGQNTLETLVEGSDNLLSSVFAGRTEGADEQRSQLRLLGVPTKSGYEKVLGSLSPAMDAVDPDPDASREFLWSDGMGHVQKIEVWRPPYLREPLNTTPGRVVAPETVPA